MFNFHKGAYVIKALCNWVQKWTRVISTDADITIASLNSLRNLALDFIIHFFVLLFICREQRNLSNMSAVRASTVIHVGQTWGAPIRILEADRRSQKAVSADPITDTDLFKAFFLSCRIIYSDDPIKICRHLFRAFIENEFPSQVTLVREDF